MIIIKISLGKQIFGNQEFQVPFWFTGDQSIHLSSEKSSTSVELTQTPVEILKQIWFGIKNKELICSAEDFAALQTVINNEKADKKQPIETIASSAKTAISKEEVKKIQNKSLLEEARRLLLTSSIKLTTLIGSDQIDDNIISEGIKDTEMLEAMIQVESDKVRPRKAVINKLKKRLDALMAIGITIQDSQFEITEEEVGEIVIDNKNQTISSVDNSTQENDTTEFNESL